VLSILSEAPATTVDRSSWSPASSTWPSIRLKEPDLPRPYRVPGGIAGAALLGVAPTVLIILALIQSGNERVGPLSALVFGLMLVAAGCVVFGVSRRVGRREYSSRDRSSRGLNRIYLGTRQLPCWSPAFRRSLRSIVHSRNTAPEGGTPTKVGVNSLFSYGVGPVVFGCVGWHDGLGR
jgi:hypothetical protein